MYQKKIYLLLSVSILLSAGLQAQYNPFGPAQIENYRSSETGGGEQNWHITQDRRGIIYAANDENGILEFDGSTWRSIPGTEDMTARSVITGDNGIVYAGLEGDFGFLEPDIRGNMLFRSLADSSLRQKFPDISVWKCWYGNSKVYFCGMDAIFVFTPSTGELQHLETSEFAFLTYLIGKDLYSSDYSKGLTKHDGNTFVSLPGGEYFREKNVFGLVQMDPNHLLVGMLENGVVLYNRITGSVDSTFMDAHLREELISSRVTNLMIRDQKIFVGTMNGGLYILNSQGKIIDHINQRQGLIDQTISHVYVDKDFHASSAIWITHMKGISRIELNNPLKMISLGRSGMGFGGRGSEEEILDITEFIGELFVSTIKGLYQEFPSSDITRFRPLREIREPIIDLRVISPVPGKEFLLASGREHIYVLDQNMKISKLAGAGGKMLADPENRDVFYAGNKDLSGFQFKSGAWEKFLSIEIDEVILQMCMDKLASVWISTNSGLIRLDGVNTNRDPRIVRDLEAGLPADDFYPLFADPEDGGLLVGTSRGFYHFDYMNHSMEYDSAYNSTLPNGENQILAFHYGTDDTYWFSFENESMGCRILGARRISSGFEVVHDRPFRTLPAAVPAKIFFTDSENVFWFAMSGALYQFMPDQSTEEKESFQVLMREVSIPGDSLVFYGTHFFTDSIGQRISQSVQSEEEVPRMNYKDRDIEFQWSSTYYKSRWQRFSYYLEGMSKEWSDWERNRSAKFTNLPHGRYEMLIKARNVYGDESPPARYAFVILRPWYATIFAISLYLILIASLILSVIRYTRNLRRRAEELERKNREIEQQKKELLNLNEEITSQRDEIETQRDSISAQKELIDRQKSAMTDSIVYAKRIQDAVLPAKEVMRFLLPKHFVFYRPRDIVSGDFFWVDKRDETILLAVADCTGHGVPGAFMSMLGISLLNEITSKYSDQSINEIMDELRDRVIASLGQTGDKYETRDGIEMGLLAINPASREIQYTGANMNLYTFQKGELEIIKGDRMPVGIHSEGNTFFSVRNIKMNRGDTLYLFSDGYPDQFGGKVRKKYGSARLKTHLTSIQQSIMHDQKAAVAEEFDQWKGDEDQIDDILMIGIKL